MSDNNLFRQAREQGSSNNKQNSLPKSEAVAIRVHEVLNPEAGQKDGAVTGEVLHGEMKGRVVKLKPDRNNLKRFDNVEPQANGHGGFISDAKEITETKAARSIKRKLKEDLVVLAEGVSFPHGEMQKEQPTGEFTWWSLTAESALYPRGHISMVPSVDPERPKLYMTPDGFEGLNPHDEQQMNRILKAYDKRLKKYEKARSDYENGELPNPKVTDRIGMQIYYVDPEQQELRYMHPDTLSGMGRFENDPDDPYRPAPSSHARNVLQQAMEDAQEQGLEVRVALCIRVPQSKNNPFSKVSLERTDQGELVDTFRETTAPSSADPEKAQPTYATCIPGYLARGLTTDWGEFATKMVTGHGNYRPGFSKLANANLEAYHIAGVAGYKIPEGLRLNVYNPRSQAPQEQEAEQADQRQGEQPEEETPQEAQAEAAEAETEAADSAEQMFDDLEFEGEGEEDEPPGPS